MFLHRGRRWVRQALAAVDPSALADSVETYIDLLPEEELHALALRGMQEMNPLDRAQFELYGGQKSIENGNDGLLARRITAFFRQNPRALEALGDDAIEQILRPLAPAELQPGRPKRPGFSAAALTILALAVALIPLAAQYVHQRGVLEGLSDVKTAPAAMVPLPHPPAAQPARRTRRRAMANRSKVQVRRRIARVHPRARVAVASPHRRRSNVGRSWTRSVRPGSLAGVWKFDRRNYGLFSKQSRFQQRARLEVQSYLDAVIAGDTRSALQHLGLPPDAALVNLSEVPIISRRSTAHIVVVKPEQAGKTTVEADIKGRRGEYFDVFYVAADGPAVRITDHYYIPVGK